MEIRIHEADRSFLYKSPYGVLHHTGSVFTLYKIYNFNLNYKLISKFISILHVSHPYYSYSSDDIMYIDFFCSLKKELCVNYLSVLKNDCRQFTVVVDLNVCLSVLQFIPWGVKTTFVPKYWKRTHEILNGWGIMYLLFQHKNNSLKATAHYDMKIETIFDC